MAILRVRAAIASLILNGNRSLRGQIGVDSLLDASSMKAALQ